MKYLLEYVTTVYEMLHSKNMIFDRLYEDIAKQVCVRSTQGPINSCVVMILVAILGFALFPRWY